MCVTLRLYAGDRASSLHLTIYLSFYSFKVTSIVEKSTESRLRWFGDVMRRPEGHIVPYTIYLLRYRVIGEVDDTH